MKCNRCFTITRQIQCDTCCRKNIKHNEEKRSVIKEKYQVTLKNFTNAQRENAAFIENIFKDNKRAKANCIHKRLQERIETSSYQIDTKVKQGKVLEQKISIRKVCIKKISQQAAYIKSKAQLKAKQLELINIQSKKCRQKILEELTQYFQGICEYLKGSELMITRQQWDKFLSMGEQEQTMYATLSEDEVYSVPNNTHLQLKKQIISLINLSKLLRIQLPYAFNQTLIFRNKSQDIFIDESKNIRIQLLRQMQANSQYLFSRFGIQMDYPQINSQSINKLLQAFAVQRLNIHTHNQEIDEFFTKGIYISSSDYLNINEPILQLSLDYLTEYKSSKLLPKNYKHSKQQQTSQGIDLLDSFVLQGLSSVYSDQDIQILQ